MKSNLLVLEDDELLAETLKDFLETIEFKVDIFQSAEDALEACYEKNYDLYLLDINLPKMSGFDFLKMLREGDDETPAIYITSANDTISLKKGFGAGADDYIKKPFDLEELECRIKALLNRVYHLKDKIIIDKSFELDLRQKLLKKDGKSCPLNFKDFKLLSLFMENRGSIVTKEMISKKLWNPSQEISENAIRVYVANLKNIFGKESIENIRGIGYKFVK
ncbi:MAG: response regulator transcription factor [Sulfurospirillaceae bacterium]|nr:response regulator transcription factor [Sulfurospirillaceae bacterium]